MSGAFGWPSLEPNTRSPQLLFYLVTRYVCLPVEPVNSHLFLLVGAALFAIGLAVVLLKRHAIVVLMGIELMLNAVNINLVAFSQYDPDRLQGQMLSLFVMVVAAAESAVALAIVLQVYRHFRTAQLDELNELKQ